MAELNVSWWWLIYTSERANAITIWGFTPEQKSLGSVPAFICDFVCACVCEQQIFSSRNDHFQLVAPLT